MDDLPREPQTGEELTSVHVRGACRGDGPSRAWVVEHFTPVLILQARYRLKGYASRYIDPEDLVNDVWTITLPRLPNLVSHNGRWTPVLVKFLSVTLLNRTREIMRAHIRDGRARVKAPGDLAASRVEKTIEQLPEEITNIVSSLGRREQALQLHECIDSMRERDREVLVLRGIEQLPLSRVGEILGIEPGAVSMRYRRALAHLRAALPRSVFSELDQDF